VDTGKRLNKGAKKRNRALALKIVHALDGQSDVRRADIVQQLLADQSRYVVSEVNGMISKLHNATLIQSQQGPYSRVQIA
jgi:D-alanine-D-alanine ligase-like ATP-grasp enzyme